MYGDDDLVAQYESFVSTGLAYSARNGNLSLPRPFSSGSLSRSPQSRAQGPGPARALPPSARSGRALVERFDIEPYSDFSAK